MEQPLKPNVILEPIQPEDWKFGFSGDTEIKVPDGNWTKYLPTEERQKRPYETLACTNFASTNCLELLMNRKIKEKLISAGNLNWLKDNGYIDENGNFNCSDRFDALVSKTDPNSGNTLKAPAEGKRKFGVIPEKMLPYPATLTEYYDKSKITPEMYSLGLEFLKRFPINYEFIDNDNFAEALKVSPLAGACFAWNGMSGDIFIRTTNPINHAICIIEPPDIYQIFDSYSPHIKKLANNFLFYDYAIRYILGENTDIPNSSVKKNLYKILRDPLNPNEVYAFNEDLSVKRHITNKTTLTEGAKSFDQYWVWDEGTAIPVASQSEFDGATEMAEILLLTKDSASISTGASSFWEGIKVFFKSLFGIK